MVRDSVYRLHYLAMTIPWLYFHMRDRTLRRLGLLFSRHTQG